MKYLILAAGDISKSQNNSKIDGNRNITVETDEINEPTWNRTSVSSNGCIKMILKPIDPPSENLITAFEFEGSVVKKSGFDEKSLVGCCLVVNNPDVYRGILLLKAADCKIFNSTSSVATAAHHPIPEDINGLEDDLIDQLLKDDFSFSI